MATSLVKNVAQTIIEPLIFTGGITAAVESGNFNPPQDVAGNILPFSGTFATVNMGLATLMHVHEKPKIVQIAFPFFSGLAAAALMPVFGLPTTQLLATYLFFSSCLSGLALVKVIAKAIFAKKAEPKEESKPHRVFNYVVTGTVAFIPSAFACFPLSKLFGQGDWILGDVGVFFGLAQVCVTTLLGAPQESRTLHSFLPVITSLLPSLIFGAMEPMRNPDVTAFTVIPVISVATALIGTAAIRYFASQSKATTQTEVGEEKQQQVDPRATYRRPGFSAALPHHTPAPDTKKFI